MHFCCVNSDDTPVKTCPPLAQLPSHSVACAQGPADMETPWGSTWPREVVLKLGSQKQHLQLLGTC